jgi:hypothetical protein
MARLHESCVCKWLWWIGNSKHLERNKLPLLNAIFLLQIAVFWVVDGHNFIQKHVAPHSVMDLINMLQGNSSVNTVQHTIDEAAFSTLSAPSSSGTTGLCNPLLSNSSVNTLPRKRWTHQQYRLCFLWGMCRVLIREVNAVTEWRRGRIPPPWPCES